MQAVRVDLAQAEEPQHSQGQASAHVLLPHYAPGLQQAGWQQSCIAELPKESKPSGPTSKAGAARPWSLGGPVL